MQFLWAGILAMALGTLGGLGPAAALVAEGAGLVGTGLVESNAAPGPRPQMQVAAAAPGALPALPEVSQDQMLVIGRITRHPLRQFSRLQVFNDHLAARLTDTGIRAGGVVMTRDLAEMTERLRAGEVDYLVESLYGALALEALGLVEIALHVHRNGRISYRGLMIARKDSAIRLDELGGAHLLFEDPGSTTGFFLPYLLLRSKGYRLVPAGERGADEGGALTYAFTGTETATAAGLVRGKGDLGALSDRDWHSPNKVPVTMRADLKIIGETEPLLRALLLLRTDLPRERKAALLKSLSDLSGSVAGAAVLELSEMGGIAPLSESDHEQLSRFRALYRQYAEELP